MYENSSQGQTLTSNVTKILYF